MRILDWLLGRSTATPAPEPERKSMWIPPDLYDYVPASSGVSVTPETAVTCTAVWACVRVLSETVASLPLHVYRRMAKGKERAPEHTLYGILHDAPNPDMSSFTFREALMANALLWGNAYARIERARGKVTALVPLMPDRVQPERDQAGKLRYRLDGGDTFLSPANVLHVPGLGFDGAAGYPPIRAARQAVGLALAAQEFGARFFGNGSRPGGVIESPKQLDDTAVERLRAAWQALHGGPANAHKVAVLEDGVTFKPIAVNPDEAQFLETRQFQVAEVCRVFRVPPHLIADLSRSTYSNIEHQSLEFVVHSVRPWLVRWEAELNRKLFAGTEYFAEFLVDGLLRGDVRARYQAYAIGRQNGWLSANDIREMENLNPIEGGDEYLTPANLQQMPVADPPSDERKPQEGAA